jgi:hypothetical protein
MPDTLPAAVDSRTLWRAAIEACFYGNLFYGVCAVAQVVETSVQLGLPGNGWLIVASFIGTVLFYSYPCTRGTASSADPRVAWHRRHRVLVSRLQRWALLALIVLTAWMTIRHRAAVRTMNPLDWIVLLVFPCAGGLYYAAPVTSRAITLRQSSWLKPLPFDGSHARWT